MRLPACFRPSRHPRASAVGLVPLLLAAVAGAAPPRLTVERLHDDPPLSGHLPKSLAWHPDGKRLSFIRTSGAAGDLFVLDLGKGEQTRLLEGAKVVAPGTTRPLSLSAAAWFPDGRRLLLPAGGDLYTVDVETGLVNELVTSNAEEEFASLSPDGSRVAFVRGSDLYVVDVRSRRETRLSQGGSETLLNGRLDWVYEEELASRSGRAFLWSPDSRRIGYLQLDQASVDRFPIVDFLKNPNEVFWQRYPTPGGANPVVRVGIATLAKDGTAGPERLLSVPADAYVLPQLAWTPDSRGLAFQQLNRAQNELLLRLLPAPESAQAPLGEPLTVLSERSATWLNTFLAPHFLKDGRRFLWLSERAGYAHVNLCELSGGCRPITQGPWMVDAQVSFTGSGPGLVLDERSGFLYFTATEKDPRERHLYRVRLDGSGRTRLTREDGTHRVLVAPDGRFFADTWSDTVTPPRLLVSSQDGTRRYSIEGNAHPPILDFERGNLEPLELAASDGTRLYAALLKPAGFEPSRRYPVVINVYGGPHAQTVTNSWSQVSAFDQLLASRGFLVFWLDNRGSGGRGVAFESAIHRDLGRRELQDQLRGVEYLRSLPFVDRQRIGIAGWSYGGYLALYAATHAPEVFRSVVAGAPVTDWRRYDSIYSERYMGTPADNPRGYDDSSPLRKAGELRADLLLLHGSADDNVHAANTLAFVAALARAGKPYSLQLQPGQKHGFSSKEDKIARDRAILDQLERSLQPAR